MQSKQEMHVDTEIQASPEEVYKALTDPSEFKIWDPTRAVSDIRPGGRMLWRFRGREGGITLIQVEPGRRWIGDFTFRPGWKVRSEVELVPTAHGVRISLTNRDLPTDPQILEAIQAGLEGWSGWVEALKVHVDVAKGRVLTKVVDDLRVATQTMEESDIDRLSDRLGETGPRVIEKVRLQKADAVGTVLIYHSREPWKVEVGCVLEGEVAPAEDLQVRNLAGGLVVAKPYNRHANTQTLFLHNGIEKWCGQNGYKPTGPTREIYTANIWDQKTPVPGEVQVPVTRKQSS